MLCIIECDSFVNVCGTQNLFLPFLERGRAFGFGCNSNEFLPYHYHFTIEQIIEGLIIRPGTPPWWFCAKVMPQTTAPPSPALEFYFDENQFAWNVTDMLNYTTIDNPVNIIYFNTSGASISTSFSCAQVLIHHRRILSARLLSTEIISRCACFC